MKLNLIVAAFVIAAAPVCAQAQPTPLTKADAQNVFKMIRGDKAKTQIFCDMGKLGDQMEEANAKQDFQESRGAVSKGGRIGKTTGSRMGRVHGRNSGR